jgi:hypothetical protein
MLEAAINAVFTTVVAGPDTTTAPNGALYLNGAASGITPTFVHQGSTPFWSVSFTPTATGIYSLYAFGIIQFRIPCVSKLTSQMVANIEDEALGSWTWDKTTGTLTILRQNGTTLATHTALDSLLQSSRERIS